MLNHLLILIAFLLFVMANSSAEASSQSAEYIEKYCDKPYAGTAHKVEINSCTLSVTNTKPQSPTTISVVKLSDLIPETNQDTLRAAGDFRDKIIVSCKLEGCIRVHWPTRPTMSDEFTSKSEMSLFCGTAKTAENAVRAMNDSITECGGTSAPEYK